MTAVTVQAPGRVNLIGDHTDYAGGLALPCAIDLGITIRGERNGSVIKLVSDAAAGTLKLDLTSSFDIASMQPPWGRYVAAVASELEPTIGLQGILRSTLPIGAGLSSSAALEIATALALGFEGEPMELALLSQRAELRAVGVPCGLLDQSAIIFGRANHALLIDFSSMSIEYVAFPQNLDIVIVHSGQERALVDSQYQDRREACEQAAQLIGPLSHADKTSIQSLDEPLRRRARHVATECQRVRDAAFALRNSDGAAVGKLMTESHRSLRDDFEVSTALIDQLVDRLVARPGVFGARVTGAGFGGCVVALCESGAIADPNELTGRGWIVHPSDGATLSA